MRHLCSTSVRGNRQHNVREVLGALIAVESFGKLEWLQHHTSLLLHCVACLQPAWRTCGKKSRLVGANGKIGRGGKPTHRTATYVNTAVCSAIYSPHLVSVKVKFTPSPRKSPWGPQGKGSALAMKAVERQCKGSALAKDAVVRRGASQCSRCLTRMSAAAAAATAP